MPFTTNKESGEYNLYPNEWIAKWRAAGNIDEKGFGAGGLQMSGNMFTPEFVTRGYDYDQTKHELDDDPKKWMEASRYADTDVATPLMPFKPDKIPGKDICDSGGICDPLFWVNYFFTWPLPVRQVRAFHDSYTYSDERMLPGYVKGPKHNQRYGQWDWSMSSEKYYPIGSVFEDWNGGSPTPFLDWIHFVNTTGDSASRYGPDQGGYSKGVANNYLINLSEDEPDVPAIQPKLWDLEVTYDWRSPQVDSCNVSQKLALYVFLHMVNAQSKILSLGDFSILVDAFQAALRGTDTRSYAQAGKMHREEHDADELAQ